MIEKTRLVICPKCGKSYTEPSKAFLDDIPRMEICSDCLKKGFMNGLKRLGGWFPFRKK